MADEPAVPAVVGPVPDPDEVTVLTSRGLRLAMQHERLPDGTVHTHSYEDARRFRARRFRATSLEALAARLADLEEKQCSAVIRAAVRPNVNRKAMRRLLHAQEDAPATLVEVPRFYVALDIDGLDAPDGWWLDLPSALERVRAHLPPEFRPASAIIQATGSAGIKPGLRVRVWFWLSRPAIGDELHRVLRGVPGLDLSTTYPANLIYTAKPAFIGMDDPVPVRTMLITGAVDEVTLQVLPAPPPPPRLVTAPSRPILDNSWGPKPSYSRTALERACAEIASAGDGQQHLTLFRVAAGIGQLVGSGHMPRVAARDALIQAGLQMKAYGRLWHLSEITRQIDRGLVAGMACPRDPKGGQP